MAKPKIYVETTVISYLTARPSRDVVLAAHQQVTRDWWDRRDKFELTACQLVVQEASAGDPVAAHERLQAMIGIPLLAAPEDALQLSRALLDSGAVPKQAAEDALHIAVAAVNGVEYLVTWNYKHLANATKRVQIEDICRDAGYEPPVICTPEELLESE